MTEDERYLSGVGLADEASSIGGSITILGKTETFYVRVNGYPRRACDGCGRRWREGVVSDGGGLLLHGRGRVSVKAETRVSTATSFVWRWSGAAWMATARLRLSRRVDAVRAD